MATYQLHLENSTETDGNADNQNFANDDEAVREAAAAAGEVLASELVEGRATPQATVTVLRDGVPIARVRATATIERLT